MTFTREGWTPGILKVRYADGEASSSQRVWTRGSFAIFEIDYVDLSAGQAACAPLVHRATGYHLVPFGELEGAAIAAELLEPLAPWDELLRPAKTVHEAREAAWEIIAGGLPGYTVLEPTFDSAQLLYRPYRSS